ncbi:related to DNA polymerase V [Phialocephala subalpina]|uniref:Related to DNA polymerase V n=1 Tax=Phialocephala subalpina TaxID=576137 RepID=A0A1L7WBT7_9HELO|nr:related to DNA polymerase V [Phialocephala subalpina]
MGQKRKRPAQDAGAAASKPKKQQKTNQKVEKAPTKSAAAPEQLDTSPFVDNPKGADLAREVQLYSLLSSDDDGTRIKAAIAVVSGLVGGDGVEESTLQRHLERKLFRGLASGAKSARLGFSIALTEILGQLYGTKDLAAQKYTSLTFDKVLGFLVAKTKPDGDLSGQEIKDHHLGLLFGLESFIGAKFLFGDDQRWNEILGKLLELAKKKPWIREQCGYAIMKALPQMSQAQAEYTLSELVDAGLALSPEGVGIWLTARSRFPNMKLPSKPWGQSGNPLEHLKSLGKALKESSSSDETQQAKQTGNWNAKLHFVWEVVLAEYAAAAQKKVHNIKSDFENFWKVAVDENLFSSTASRERKFWGFLLFQRVVEDAQSFGKLLPSVFSHNLVRCLINHVQDEDRFLHRAADKSLKVLIQAAEAKPKLLETFLPHLISGNGNYNFDRITNTKTIERLLALVNEKTATSVIEILVKPARSVAGSEPDQIAEADRRRQLLGDYLLNFIRKVNTADESANFSWVSETALPTIAKFAYSEDEKCQPPLSDKTRGIFRNRLMSAFGHLLSNIKGYTYPCQLLTSFAPDAILMDSEISNTRDNAISTMEKILKKTKKATETDKAPLQGLALLYSLVIFQLYNGESEAISILEELRLCYDKLIRHKDTEDSDADASEVLVELLLSFISKPSALLRKVTQHVFGAFISDMTAGGLKLMTDVLQSSESLRGQQDLFDQEPEDGEAMDEDEDGELDSDVEVVDMDADEGDLNDHLHKDGGEESDDDDDDDDDNDDEDESGSADEEDEDAKKLDNALAAALGTHRLDQDDEVASDSDADMTDSEMMALDSKLVEIFSQRKKTPNKKQEQKDAKETMVNFKTRVLDLLDLYVKKQASNPLAFGLLLPLLELMRTTKTKQLAEKAHNIILAFAKASKGVKKVDGILEVNVAEQVKLLKAIHLEASKDPSHVFAKAASTASLLVAGSIYRVDKGNFKKIATVYRDSQVSWVDGEEKMQAAFFSEFVNWCQSHAKS